MIFSDLLAMSLTFTRRRAQIFYASRIYIGEFRNARIGQET